MFCWHCGKEIYPGAFFCTNCGTKAAQPQEPGQQEAGNQEPPVRMMPHEPVVQPVEAQESVVPPAPEPIVQPVEAQESVVPPAPGPEVQLMEMQAPVVQVPPAVIVPPAPVMQSGEAQRAMPAGSGMQVPMTSMPAEPGMQRYVSAVPAEQKPAPKPLKKGLLVTVILAAVLVFLVGVAGAFYFAEAGDDSDGGMTQGRREELENDNSVSHREDIGEYSQLEKFDNIDGKEEEEIGNNSEVQKDDPEAAGSANSREDPIKENQSAPWEDQIEENRIPAFSGRDIYPGIDGYAEGRPGDSMHTYWFDYTVVDAYICTEYGGYLPKDGYEVLVVEMAVRNTFDEWIPMFDDDFQAQWNDMSDDAYAWPIEDAELLGEDVLPSYYELEEGQVARGLLLFEVPVGYTDFSLAYWEIFDDDTYGDLFFLDFTVDRDQIEITI